MAYPALDANHIAQWELSEQTSDLVAPSVPLGTLDGDHTPPWWQIWRPFLDDVGGNSLGLYDTLPEAASSQFYTIGAPGPFGGSVHFHGGTATEQRDFLYGASTLEPAAITIDMWILPFLAPAAANLIQKEHNPATWVDPFVSVQIFTISSVTGTWGVALSVGGVRYFVNSIGSSDTASRLRMRGTVWNHVGMTYDGATIKAYINGLFAGQTAVAGAIDYGAHGYWVLGGSRAIGAAALDAANAAFGRVRMSNIARPLSYFYDSYQGALAEIGGAIGGPVVLAPAPITIVGSAPGGIGLGL